MRARRPLPLLTTLLVLASGVSPGAALAQGRSEVRLRAASVEVGWVGVRVDGPPGTSVVLGERTGATVTPIATVALDGGRHVEARAVPWRCDRRIRRLVASAAAASGRPSASAEVRIETPSCHGRFDVELRPRTAPPAGAAIRVRVRDRWRLGEPDARVCVAVTRAERCRRAGIPGRARAVVTRVRAARPGRAELTVSVPGHTLRRRLEVRGRRSPLRVLATGDSMIQLIDSDLQRRLGRGRRARVQSDARIATGISKPFLLDWVALAARQSRARRPHATVVFLGANEGFPIAGTACCGEPWVRAYARRARRMMASYRRRGLGRVLWLTLPVPSRPNFARVFRAVNAALRVAVRPFDPSEVALLDLRPILTPGGRFRRSIGGRVVRQDDGIHLSIAGASIAAATIIDQLRRDGFVR